MRLLYYCPIGFGGIAEYAHYQCDALRKAGVDLTMLCPPDFEHTSVTYRQEHSLAPSAKNDAPGLRGKLSIARRILSDSAVLNRLLDSSDFSHVLFATYSEYLAPLWSPGLRKLRKQNIHFSAVVHDPVRDHIVGPQWWHRASIKSGYSFLDHAFAHSSISLANYGAPGDLPLTVIPHGPYPTPKNSASGSEIRKTYGVPAGKNVFLCAGHIRDNKNLNLIIEALAQVEDAHLLVAGSRPSGSQKLAESDYYELASFLGVSDRITWDVRYLDEVDLANAFAASDYVLLTYSSTFRSASGVLALTSSFRKPVLASAGPGPLLELVDTFNLGIVIEPDSTPAIISGMQQLMSTIHPPDWDSFNSANSWGENADRVLSALTPSTR